MSVNPLALMAIAGRLGSRTVDQITDEDISFVFEKLDLELTPEREKAIALLKGEAKPSEVATLWLQNAYSEGRLTSLFTAIQPEEVWVRCPHCMLPFDATTQLNATE